MSRVDGVFKEFPRTSDLGELFPPDKVVIHSIYLVRARLTRGARHCNVEVDITSAKTGKHRILAGAGGRRQHEHSRRRDTTGMATEDFERTGE